MDYRWLGLFSFLILLSISSFIFTFFNSNKLRKAIRQDRAFNLNQNIRDAKKLCDQGIVSSDKTFESLIRVVININDLLDPITKFHGDIKDYKKYYNGEILGYKIYSSIIQIYPLYGILGTIAGLRNAMGTEVDFKIIEEIIKQFSLAIDTTIYGLVASALCILLDSFVLSNKIEKDRLEYEKNIYPNS